jgi:hypothetical protein
VNTDKSSLAVHMTHPSVRHFELAVPLFREHKDDAPFPEADGPKEGGCCREDEGCQTALQVREERRRQAWAVVRGARLT